MDKSQWPNAAVAIALILLVTSITVAAIHTYKTVDELLKVWGALTGIIGVITGTIVTYFFTRVSQAIAEKRLEDAQKRAEIAETIAGTSKEAAIRMYSSVDDTTRTKFDNDKIINKWHNGMA